MSDPCEGTGNGDNLNIGDQFLQRKEKIEFK